MNLYLDDDTASKLLVHLLRRSGHDVELPSDVGLARKHDAVHLKHAIGSGRVIISHNHADFEELHDLLMEAQGHHPGIWVIRRDNDRKRDLKPSGIVRAIVQLLAAAVPLGDHYYYLNNWR